MTDRVRQVRSAETRVLIGTMYSGENEYEDCLASIRAQTHENREYFEIRHRPNREAHDQLYREFMARKDDFDLFCKLDADMVFANPRSLTELVSYFDQDPDLDHLEIAVHDWFSDSKIMGVHVFSPRATWLCYDGSLFVDYKPSIPGRYLAVSDPPQVQVLHSPNPSPFQAYHFGVHRALKVLQTSESEFNYYQHRAQWHLLQRVWDHFLRTKDRRLGFGIFGAEEVFNGQVDRHQYDYTDPQLRARFGDYQSWMAEDLEDRLSPVWGTPWARATRQAKILFPHLPSLAYQKIGHWMTDSDRSSR